MKSILQLCFFLSIPLSIHSQVILEKTYPTTDLHRVNWTFDGEKYWYSDDSLKEIKVFSGQHQLVKTIRYPSVLNSQVRLLQSEQAVTQTTVNGDDLLEMIWFFKDTLTKREQMKIMNERDSVLFTFNSVADSISFSEIEGLPTKLFITMYENGLENYITNVYNLPTLNLDNIYFRAHRLYRKKFGYAGEKYFYKDIEREKMQIYNSDHNFWKGINLKFLTNINLQDYDEESYTDADDNVFSKDSLVEVVFSYYSSGNALQAIINENGVPLIKSNWHLRLDHKDGLKDKLFVGTWRSSADNYFRMYRLPSFEIAKQSFYLPSRTNLNKYGETIVEFSPNILTLSDSNIIIRKRINLPVTPQYSVFYPYTIFPYIEFPIVTDSIINKDSLIEVIYAEYNYRAKQYTTKIINDTGFIYKTIDDTRYFAINQTKSLENKLITKTGNDKPYDTKVWRFGNTTAIKETPSVFQVNTYPNPFSQALTVEVKENTVFPLTLRLINTLGKVVYTTKSSQSSVYLNLPNLAKGEYFLEINNGKEQTVKQIVKME